MKKPIVAAVIIIALIGAIAYAVSSGSLSGIGIGKSETQRKVNASTQLYAAQGYVIGKTIATDNAGAKVVVLVNDADMDKIDAKDDNNRVAAFCMSLEEGFGGNVTIEPIVISALAKMSDEQKQITAGVPFNQMISGADFNNAIDKAGEADVLVVACAIPSNMGEAGRIKDLNKKNNKIQVYLMSNIASDDVATYWLNNKSITAVVDRKKGYRVGDDVPSDYEKAFALAYEMREQ